MLACEYRFTHMSSTALHILFKARHSNSLCRQPESRFYAPGGDPPPNVTACRKSSYRVSGNHSQSSINGVYYQASQLVHGHSYYTKATGKATRVLYWMPGAGGKWVVADQIGRGFRAVQPDGSTPAFGPPSGSIWLVLGDSWAMETVTVTFFNAGFAGLLCALCAKDFYRSHQHKCAACNTRGQGYGELALMALLLLLAVGGVLVRWARGWLRRRHQRTGARLPQNDAELSGESNELTLFESPFDSSAPDDAVTASWHTRVQEIVELFFQRLAWHDARIVASWVVPTSNDARAQIGSAAAEGLILPMRVRPGARHGPGADPSPARGRGAAAHPRLRDQHRRPRAAHPFRVPWLRPQLLQGVVGRRTPATPCVAPAAMG